jgi:6-phosphogluconolactonase (cycloisomerase 2 family)
MNKKILLKLIIALFFVGNITLQASCPVLVQTASSPYSLSQAIELSFSPNGTYLAVSNGAGVTVYSVNNNTGNLTFSSTTATSFTNNGSIAWSPNGKFGIVSNQSLAQVQAFTINSTTGVWTPGAVNSGLPAVASQVTYSPNSQFAAITSQFDAAAGLGIYSVNQSTGALTLLQTYATASAGVSGVAYSPNGDFIAAVTASGVYLFAVDSITGLLTPIAGSPINATLSSPKSVAYSPDGQFAAVGNEGNGTVSVFAVNEEGLFVNTVPGSPYTTGGTSTQNPATPVAYSPNGNFAVIGSAQGSTNIVAVYTVNQTTGQFTPLSNSPLSLVAGVGAISVQFSAGSNFIAAVNLAGIPNNDSVSTVKLFGLAGDSSALSSAAIDVYGRVSAYGYSAQPSLPVTLYADCTTMLGTTTADTAGNFSIVASTVLPTDIYRITAAQTISSCTAFSSPIVVGASMLSPFIQRVLEKYNNGC